MNTDFRVAVTLPTHPKTIKLMRRIGDRSFYSLVRLWAWVTTNRPSGDLSGLDDEDLEIAADWQGEMGAFVQALASLGLLDGESGAYSVHDWQERNPWAAEADDRSDKARLSNFLGRFPEAKAELEKAGIKGLSQDQYQEWAEQFKARARASSAATAPRTRASSAATAPRTRASSAALSPSLTPSPSQEEIAERETRARATPPPHPADDPDILFEQFWDAYPRKEARDEAWAEWKAKKKARKLPGINVLLDALAVQTDSEQWSKEDGRFIPSPAKWIKGGRWADKLAPAQAGGGTPQARAPDLAPRTYSEAQDAERRARAMRILAKQQGGAHGTHGADASGHPGRTRQACAGLPPGQAE